MAKPLMNASAVDRTVVGAARIGGNAPVAAGIGLRAPHAVQLMRERPSVGFLEVHAENYFSPSTAARAFLRDAAEIWPVSVHGVGLSLGSASGLDEDHLDRLAGLVRELQPLLVSEHASFARTVSGSDGGMQVLHANDLLPVAYTRASLDILAANVHHAQERLGRPLLIENVCAYLRWADEEMGEADYLAELATRTGCGLLLDLNNLMVNALNAGAPDPLAQARGVIDALPTPAIGEIHLAGYTPSGAATGGADAIVVDDHGAPVGEAVWALLGHTLSRLERPVPMLVEWDTRLPPLQTLLAQARRADHVAMRTLLRLGANGVVSERAVTC